MYSPLGLTRLKSGEIMNIGVLDAPDAVWRGCFSRFLAHKGSDWLPQIELALSEPLDGLQTWFYTGMIEDELACQTMITGNGSSAALISHVYTAPQHRRKGAIHALLGALMDECRPWFQCITLGAEYGSPAYKIYESLGYKSVEPGRGEMVWSADGQWSFPPALQPNVDISVHPAKWEQWPSWNLLAFQPDADDASQPRSAALGLYGQGSIELEFIKLQFRRKIDPGMQAYTLTSGSAPDLGWAILARGNDTPTGEWILDLHAHPSARHHLSKLAHAIQFPDAPVSCLMESRNLKSDKAAALIELGFSADAEPVQWRDSSGRTRDVCKLVRR